MSFSEYAGRRPLYGEAIAYQEHVSQLLDSEREFQTTMMKFLLQAIITGKVRN